MVVVFGRRSVCFFGLRWTVRLRGSDGLIDGSFRSSEWLGVAELAGVLRPSLAWASRLYTLRVIGEPCGSRIDS